MQKYIQTIQTHFYLDLKNIHQFSSQTSELVTKMFSDQFRKLFVLKCGFPFRKFFMKEPLDGPIRITVLVYFNFDKSLETNENSQNIRSKFNQLP